MSVKRLLAVFVAVLMLSGLAVPNEALCAAGLYSQEIALLQALKTVKELEIKSADEAGDTELSESLGKELQEIQRKIDSLKKLEKEQIDSPTPNFKGLG